MGVKQGCPLSRTEFRLYVDELERHLLETADIDVPAVRGVLVPLLLYADDLILMSTTAAGLQKQLDALASLCDKRPLTVTLSKTTIMISEARHGSVADLVLSSVDVESVVSFKYLGFTFHATRDMSFRTVAAATENNFDYASAVCTPWHQGPCSVMQAI